jgi:polyisoprenoid-binding protein YceI
MRQELRTCSIALALIATVACSPQNPEAPSSAAAKTAEPTAPVASNIPAGAYVLDKAHASLIFRVNHLGFSNYTARFKHFDAQLQFDPANLAASSVNATIDVRSLETDFPDPAKLDFNATLQGEQWLSAAQFPEITYRSTAVEVTGPKTMRITRDFTLRGITKPLTLDAKFNGGYAGHPMDPQARIGFSATGSLKRSDFGISYGIPEPGSTMGVSDAVEVVIETEFSGPPLPGVANQQPPEHT